MALNANPEMKFDRNLTIQEWINPTKVKYSEAALCLSFREGLQRLARNVALAE